MAGADAPDASAGSAAGDRVAAGESRRRQGLFIGAAWNARENAVILTHDGECVALPIDTAIALRDALSVAIGIPDRARAMSGGH